MRKLLKILAFLSILPLIACGRGGGNPGSSPQQIVSVSVNPPSGFTGFIGITQTLQFTAGVTGTTNTGVTWAVNSIAGGNSSVGTMSSSGLYTAPNQIPNPQKISVTATSQADTTKSASTSVFISRIPPSGSWKLMGPPGGLMTVLAEDRSHSGTVYAGTAATFGLWKSTDAGGTWTKQVTNAQVDARAIRDIAVPTSGGGNTVYICNSAFSVSQDGGATWKDVATSAPALAMAVDAQNRAIIYLSSPGHGVLKSSDSGLTWSLLPNSPIIADGSASAILHNPLETDLAHEGTVYYGTDHGMFVSRDGGATWTASTSGFSNADISIRDVAANPADAGTVFALAGAPTSTAVDLYQTTNQGASWTLLSSGLDAARVVPDLANPTVVYLFGLQIHVVYQSADSGHTFHPATTACPSALPHPVPS